jgi:dienelactone hydrolase
MARQQATGISPTTIRFGKGVGAVRALPKVRGKRPGVIILHERYGIDQHTKDLTVKLAQAGFVGLAPDLFHRFDGDRKAVLRGEQRVDLTDDGALEDLNGAVEYLKRSPNVDGTRIGIIGVCQTGRQPLLLAANRSDIAAAVVLYGAIGGKEWLSNDLRPTPVEDLVAQVNCPVVVSSARPITLFPSMMWPDFAMPWKRRRRIITSGSGRSARLVERYDARALPQRVGPRCLEFDDVIFEKMLREGLGHKSSFVDF